MTTFTQRTSTPYRCGRRAAVVVATGLLLLAACGGDDGDSAASTSAAATTATHDHDHDAPTLSIGAQDYSFTDVPETVAAGTRLSITNASSTEVHELIAVKLAADDARTESELIALPPADLGALIGPAPAAVIIAPPASDGFAVVGDGVLAEPGRYLLICSIPIGADPDEYLAAAHSGDGPPQVAGGAPHFTAGMHAMVTVE